MTMGERINILYVDDDVDIRTVAEMALGLDDGLTVTTASSAEEALAMLDAREMRPDVALLDVMMPGMDGPALAGELRRRAGLADLPVIFMTARARSADIADYHALGQTGVILKPFDPISLAQQIRARIKHIASGSASTD